jgi:sulfur-carrier protein
MIRVVLPFHLRRLAGLPEAGDTEVLLEGSPLTTDELLTLLERRYPVLRGTIRDTGTLKRRPMVRFFACGEDISLESQERELPQQIRAGQEPFLINGAIAGG